MGLSRARLAGRAERALVLGVLILGGCADQPTRLRVLTTHDVHGAVVPVTYPWSDGRLVGGFAAAKTAMDRAEEECACPTIRLDGGDQMQGTLESNLVFGTSAVEAFNLLGLDAAAIGNHDLDWGVDTLIARQSEADYLWLAANVYDRATGMRPSWARPYAVLEISGVRVGVVGYITSTTDEIVFREIVEPYEFRRGLSGVADALEAVRNEGPDFVVIVAHAGGSCVEERCRGELVELAREMRPGGVDLMVGGHLHAPAYGLVNGIPIVRAGSGARAVGVVDLRRDASGATSHAVRVDTVFVDRVMPDSAVTQAMARYRARTETLSLRTVLNLDDPLPRGPGEHPLGRVMVDAVRAEAQAQVAISNRGGIRTGLPAGPVTYGDAFRVKPFGNVVHRLRVPGSVLREAVEHLLRDAGPDFVSGLQVRFDPSRPEGERVVEVALESGVQLDDEALYTLGVSNFVAGGGDGYTMLSGFDAEWVGRNTLDALIDHLGDRGASDSAVPPPRLDPVETAR